MTNAQTNTDDLPAFLQYPKRKEVTQEVLPPEPSGFRPMQLAETPKATEPPSIGFTPAVTTGFRTAAATKGTVDNRVSKQWANRPDDERYTDLREMREAVYNRYTQCVQLDGSAHDISVINDDAEDLRVQIGDYATTFTNWSFTQLCKSANIPPEYIKRISDNPALVSQCLKDGISRTPNEAVRALLYAPAGKAPELRAVTSAKYGRIYDYMLLDQLIKIAGDGRGETNWKIPGAIDWGTSNGVTVHYNPFIDITKDTTTLYASDRDVYTFLVDDTRPIEIGKLENGEPDLLFRGFAAWNSETGSQTFGMCTFLMRGVCCNRNVWGIEGKNELRMRHSASAPERFAKEAFPMLAAYTHSPTIGVVSKVAAAKALRIARTGEERMDFLTGKIGLNKTLADKVISSVLREEGHELTSLWDVVQGMTAVARGITHQDTRIELEARAGKLMDKVSA